MKLKAPAKGLFYNVASMRNVENVRINFFNGLVL
jgi:hypothetical protein